MPRIYEYHNNLPFVNDISRFQNHDVMYLIKTPRFLQGLQIIAGIPAKSNKGLGKGG